MKASKYICISILALATLLFSCSKDGADIPEEEKQSQIMAGTWNVGANSKVLRDGDDITSQYEGFSAFFTEDFAYYVDGDPNNVIYPEGIWKYVDGDYTKILLNNDDRPISAVLSEDEKNLTLSFTNETNVPLGGRAAGISGSYTIILSKE